MENTIVPLSTIDPDLQDWTTVVQVIEKTHLIRFGGPQTHYQQYALADPQGLRVNMHIPAQYLQQLDSLLLPFKTYYVSNAIVRPSLADVPAEDYPYYWVAAKQTRIHQILQLQRPCLPLSFHLHPFAMLDALANTNHLINIMGKVLHVLPRRETTIRGKLAISRDYVIADPSLRPMLLTLCNQIEETHGPIIASQAEDFPVLIAIRIKVTTKNYLSLSTERSSVILINPDVQEAVDMHNWFSANSTQSTQLVTSTDYTNPNVLLPPPNDDQIMYIATAKQIEVGTAWIRGSAEISYQDNKMYRMICPTCEEPHYSTYIMPTFCQHCEHGVQLLPRACISLSLSDTTGSLYATAIDAQAEKLLGYSTYELYHAHQQNINIGNLITPKLHGRTVICCIQPPPSTIKLSQPTAFNIVTSYFLDDLLHIHQLNFNSLNIQDEN